MTGKSKFKKSIASSLGERGFSLGELMVVMVIIAILAVGTVSISRRPVGDVKGAIFNLRSDLGFARAEAAKRNTTLLVEFISGATDGYKICIDDQPAGAPDGVCSNVGNGASPNVKLATDDTMIKPGWDPETSSGGDFIRMNQIVQFYDAAIAGGPGVAAGVGTGATETWPVTGQDGITFSAGAGALNVRFLADGGADENGEIYLYSPPAMAGGVQPFALLISQSGVMRILRWNNNAWTSR